MGHIKCNHAKSLVILKEIKKLLGNNLISDAIKKLLIQLGLEQTGLEKLEREGEYSADAAGLICVNDLEFSQQVLLLFASGLGRDTIGRIVTDDFVQQVNGKDISLLAELIQSYRGTNENHPYLAFRIKHLDQYAQDARYQKLWNTFNENQKETQ